MLVLSRKLSQQVIIGSDVSITIVRIDRNQVRIGISCRPVWPFCAKNCWTSCRTASNRRRNNRISLKPNSGERSERFAPTNRSPSSLDRRRLPPPFGTLLATFKLAATLECGERPLRLPRTTPGKGRSWD